jgi:hypothetical protein
MPRAESGSIRPRSKTAEREIRPVYHWTPRRIVARVQLCTFALQIKRAAEIRTGLSWTRLAHELTALKAVRYRTEARTIVQRTRIRSELGDLLNKLAVSVPKQPLAVSEPAAEPPIAWIHARNPPAGNRLIANRQAGLGLGMVYPERGSSRRWQAYRRAARRMPCALPG